MKSLCTWILAATVGHQVLPQPAIESDQSGSPTTGQADKTNNLISVEPVNTSWGRGRNLFLNDERTQCSTCHLMSEEKPKAESQQSLLMNQDADSVLRSMQNPELKEHHGGWEQLAEEEKQSLLTYMTTPAPRMPADSPLTAPPLRSMEEVMQALAGSTPLPEPLRPLHLVLVDGVKDHGPGEHDYPAWQTAWRELLRSANEVTVTTARDFPDETQLAEADVLIFFQKGSFSLRRAALLDTYLKRGGGVVLIHWAVNGNDRAEEFSRRIGLASKAGGIRYRHGPLTLDVTNQDHPIMRNIERLQLYDESYWELSGDPAQVTVLATSHEDEQDTPQLWIKEHHPGRVFVSIPGHYSWTFDDPLFRIILLRGIAWAAEEPVDRWNDLVFPGARMSSSPGASPDTEP